MAKIIFLDIDGVLNSQAAWQRQKDGLVPGWGPNAPEGTPKNLIGIDPVHVAVLDEICKTSGAQIVVSSSWRNSFSDVQIMGFLRRAGFTGDLIGHTPSTWSYRPRGYDIQQWLDENAVSVCECSLPEATTCAKCGGAGKIEWVEKFVILDDCNDMAHLVHKLFQTDHDKGLLPEHVPQILSFLE